MLVEVYNSTGTIISAQTQTLQTDSTGQVFFTVPVALAAGNYTLHTTPTDIAGNTGLTATLPFTVDKTTNVAISAISPDTFGVGTTGTATDFLTNTNLTGHLSVSGTNEAGDLVVVKLLDHTGALIGTETVPAAAGIATWTADLSTIKVFDFAGHTDDNNYTVSVTATDAAGNTATATHGLIIDTTVAAPAIALLNDSADPHHLIGTTSDGTTNAAIVQIGGTTEPGAWIQIFEGGVSLGAAGLVEANATTGVWTLNVPSLANPSIDTFTGQATDAAGNVSITGSPLVVTIDRTPPAVTPAISLTFAHDTAGGEATHLGLTPAVYDENQHSGRLPRIGTRRWHYDR